MAANLLPQKEHPVSVDSWQPVQALNHIEAASLDKLIDLANQFSEGADFTPDLNWIQPLVNVDNKTWSQSIKKLHQAELVAIIRLLTVLEDKHGWGLAEKSPVIALFKQLRKIAGIDKELVQWVKAHSENQFLPFGPLL